MSSFNVSRRQWVSMLGVAAVAVPCRSLLAADKVVPQHASGAKGTGVQSTTCPLLAPLQAGSKLGSWTVDAISAVHAGAITVRLRDASGGLFCVDICARDAAVGAKAGPARTARYDLFLANEGDGDRPTNEDHGRAAMALAEIIRTNEHGVQLQGMLTLRDRLSLHRDRVGQQYRHG
jgi:hypothetical protein